MFYFGIFIGFILGAIAAMMFTVYIGTRSLKKKKEEKKPSKASVTDRMKRVKEITLEQLDLQATANGPQKNGLDGKNKNSLIGQVKKLEEEKVGLLKSIITDGFDPEVTVMDEAGVVSTLKLSEYMVQQGIVMEPTQEELPPPPQTKQMGKFTVYKGGKDDGGSNTTH